MKLTYAVVYERTPNNYSAYAPDVPGCIAAADTRAEVEELMREAITYHLEMLRDYGDPIPEPQLSVEEAMNFHSDSLAADDAAVSTISFWEVGMQVQKGRLDFRLDLDAWRRTLLQEDLVEIPVDGETAARAGLLPNMHGDPADRLIVATALAGHQLVTADRRILEWPAPLRRLDATH